MELISIGRDHTNKIVLNDPFVSRFHSQIIMHDNGQVSIKDMGSSNGTYINGKKVTEFYLHPGDTLKCASIIVPWEQYTNDVVPMQDFNQPSHPKNVIEQLTRIPKKKFLIVNYAVIAFLFFLPFCDIKCSDRVLTTISGTDLMIGTTVPNTSADPFSLSQNKEIANSSNKIDPNFFVIMAFLSAVAGGLILLIRNKQQFKISFYLGLVGFISMIGFIIQIQNNIKEMVSIEFRFPLFLVFIGFIVAAILSYLEGFRNVKVFSKNTG